MQSDAPTINIQRDVSQQLLKWEEDAERMMIEESVMNQLNAGTEEVSPQRPISRANDQLLSSEEERERLILGEFLCDFGDIVKGNQRRRAFKITNIGYLTISFDLPKQLLKDSPFTIEPDKAKKVAGFPRHESVQFKVICQTNDNTPLGPIELSLPIDIKDGPSYRLIMRANIVTPDVSISGDRLDFGKVIGKLNPLSLYLIFSQWGDARLCLFNSII
jgi:hydrocephalus-inducing protein